MGLTPGLNINLSIFHLNLDQIFTQMRLRYYNAYLIHPINSAKSASARFILFGALLYGKVKNSFEEIKKVSGNVKKV